MALLVACIPRGSPAPQAPGESLAANSAFGIPSAPSPTSLDPAAASGSVSHAATMADGLPLRYDPQGLDVYFAARPLQVLKRNGQVSAELRGWQAHYHCLGDERGLRSA